MKQRVSLRPPTRVGRQQQGLAIEVAVDKAAGVVVVVHAQQGAAWDEAPHFLRKCCLAGARWACQPHLRPQPARPKLKACISRCYPPKASGYSRPTCEPWNFKNTKRINQIMASFPAAGFKRKGAGAHHNDAFIALSQQLHGSHEHVEALRTQAAHHLTIA